MTDFLANDAPSIAARIREIKEAERFVIHPDQSCSGNPDDCLRCWNGKAKRDATCKAVEVA